MDVDFSGLLEGMSEKDIKKKVKRSVEAIAMEWEAEAKRIVVADNKIDTGQFLNSIHHEMFEEGEDIGFMGYDGVDYGKYIEFGVTKHWVPFFYKGDTSKPVLAPWGHRVLGLSEEEMLDMGGIQVELDELMPFRKALIHVEDVAQEMFNEEFKD